MKLYESAYTYIPFVYFLTIGSLFGYMYHEDTLEHYRPFVVLTYLLINTNVTLYFKTKLLIRNIIHKHVWQTVTMAFFGILLNITHEMVFEGFHFQSDHVNYMVSVSYLVFVNIAAYYFESDSALIYLHILFFYFPIRRDWQVNLYLYLCYITLSILIMYSKCSHKTLIDPIVHYKPVLRFFVYLRLNEAFVIFGFIQLFLEYYKSRIVEIKILMELQDIIDDEVRKINGEFDNGL